MVEKWWKLSKWQVVSAWKFPLIRDRFDGSLEVGFGGSIQDGAG